MTTIEAPVGPGSFAAYQEQHPGVDTEQAAVEYYSSLEEYRNALAAFHGISREELHDMCFKAGQISTIHSTEVLV